MMTDLYKLNAEFFKPYLSILKYFRCTGINIFDENNVLIYKYQYTKYVIFLLYIINLINHGLYVIQEVIRGIDLLDLAVDLSYCFNIIEGCLIYLHICLIKKRIKDYVMKLEKQWRSDDSLPTNIVLLKRDHLKQLHLYIFIYCSLTRVFINGYMASPLIIILVKKYILKRDVDYITPLKFSLPFNYQENIMLFFPCYLLDYALACNLTYLINCSLFFLSVSMIQLRTLFAILKEDFNEIIRSKEDIDDKLKQTIQRHSVLSELLTELGSAFGAIFAIHIFFVSATICFYGITARINSRPEDFKNFLISVITTITIYYSCKHGQLATDSASDIATAIYDSPWEDMTNKNKKMILLIILRSQRAVYIRSTSFTTISLKTFITIMNMTWSILSLITTLYEE